MFLYLSLLGAGVLIGLDQLIKWWAASYLSTVPDIRLIDGVLHLLYRENYGAVLCFYFNPIIGLENITGKFIILIKEATYLSYL